LSGVATLAAVAIIALAAPAGASASVRWKPPKPQAPKCDIPASTPVFAAFGDTNAYFLAPGGSFEDGLTWTAQGRADVVGVNDPFALGAEAFGRSLWLHPGGAVVTPKLCVTADLPHLRFVAKTFGSGQLDVEVRVYGLRGEIVDSSIGGISPSDHRQWAATRFVDLKTQDLQHKVGYIDVVFRSQGDWLIDDVYIDPRARV
jgi:hypothetical protein